jgi:EpsI family protein
MKSLRFWTVALMLVGTAVLLHRRGNSEHLVASEPLSKVPDAIAEWTGVDQRIDPESLEVLGRGDFLSRVYTLDKMTPPIGLFIGFFPSQRTGVTIHSPKNCLPGAGWTFESSDTVTLQDVNGKLHRVGEYVIADGDQRQFVIYWYQAHGRSVANEYMAKVYLVVDAIRMNRSDGALVRVITPIQSSDENTHAKTRAEAFAARLLPALPRFIPD